MSHLGYHIRFRLVDGSVIADSQAKRLEVIRVVLKHGRRYNLLAASLAASHLHAQNRVNRPAAGRFTHGVEASLKQRLGLRVGFVQYEPEPIRNQSHAHNAFRYILTQHQRHKLETSQVVAASNVPDLLGLRVLGSYTRDNVRRWLPRVTRAKLLRWLAWPPPEPADSPLSQLHQAARAASGLDNLHGSSQPVIATRRAMLAVIGPRLTNCEAAALLDIRPRTVTWLRTRAPDEDLVLAIRLQLGMRGTPQREPASLLTY